MTLTLRGDTRGKRLLYACNIPITHHATQHEACRHRHRCYGRYGEHRHRTVVGVTISYYRFARVRIRRKVVAVLICFDFCIVMTLVNMLVRLC